MTAIICLTGLGIYVKDVSVAISIASVAIGIAAANSYQKKDVSND